METKGFFLQFEIIINVLVRSVRFHLRVIKIRIYRHYKFVNTFSASVTAQINPPLHYTRVYFGLYPGII